MNVKRLLWYTGIAFGLFFLIQAPAEAARLVKATGENAGDWFTTAAAAFSTFLQSLV
jgi:hypothetical protein